MPFIPYGGRRIVHVVDNDDALAVLVEMLGRWTHTRVRLLADHVPDANQRCRACTAPGYGTPSAPWPCLLATAAQQAEGAAMAIGSS